MVLEPLRVSVGIMGASLGGALILWLFIDIWAWGHLEKHGITRKPKGMLSLPVGIVERVLYTMVFIIGPYEWVAIWLVLKVAPQWDRWKGEERATYNVFLLGNASSIILSILGALYALGKLPAF